VTQSPGRARRCGTLPGTRAWATTSTEKTPVNELQQRAAEILGTEAALFVPSGTMGNQVAARTHTERGQELLCERESHIYKWELAGLAQASLPSSHAPSMAASEA